MSPVVCPASESYPHVAGPVFMFLTCDVRYHCSVCGTKGAESQSAPAQRALAQREAKGENEHTTGERPQVVAKDERGSALLILCAAFFLGPTFAAAAPV